MLLRLGVGESVRSFCILASSVCAAACRVGFCERKDEESSMLGYDAPDEVDDCAEGAKRKKDEVLLRYEDDDELEDFRLLLLDGWDVRAFFAGLDGNADQDEEDEHEEDADVERVAGELSDPAR